MSSVVGTKEDTELKGGHAPAVKVAGMRVATKTAHPNAVAGEKPAEVMNPEEDGEVELGESPPKTDKHHQSLLISGVVTKGDKDFPPAAVKSYHEKPVPAHDKRTPAPQLNMHINQPRK
ncbi:death-associated protein 1-like [Gigantopelta aegis]|uniref:death-associated protein 1-like n=1 Tax=Gigantopelta aegis TaxID=1735272 RepID=UPI001B88DDF8|nr:death-associated protein 1-like [Gigantopelta aegis]